MSDANAVGAFLQAAEHCLSCFYGDDIAVAKQQLSPLTDQMCDLVKAAGFDPLQVRQLSTLSVSSVDEYWKLRPTVEAMLVEAARTVTIQGDHGDSSDPSLTKTQQKILDVLHNAGASCADEPRTQWEGGRCQGWQEHRDPQEQRGQI